MACEGALLGYRWCLTIVCFFGVAEGVFIHYCCNYKGCRITSFWSLLSSVSLLQVSKRRRRSKVPTAVGALQGCGRLWVFHYRFSNIYTYMIKQTYAYGNYTQLLTSCSGHCKPVEIDCSMHLQPFWIWSEQTDCTYTGLYFKAV